MRVIFVLLLFHLNYFLPAQTEKGQLTETEQFVFYGHYWMNMHHFFMEEALLRLHGNHSILPKAAMKQMDNFEVQRIENTVEYYMENLSDEDLQTSDYMKAFKSWIITQDQHALKGIPAQFKTHCFNLIQASLTYRTYLWDDHQKTLNDILGKNLELIKMTEIPVINQLEKLTQGHWQEEKIRVDLCFTGINSEEKGQITPYNTLNPTQVVMTSNVAESPKGNWLEVLYQQAGGNLISPASGEVSNTISEVSAEMLINSPKDLWLAYWYYFTGEAVKQVLAKNGVENYAPSIVRNEPFTECYSTLDKYLPLYISGKKTLHAVTKKIVKKVNR